MREKLLLHLALIIERRPRKFQLVKYYLHCRYYWHILLLIATLWLYITLQLLLWGHSFEIAVWISNIAKKCRSNMWFVNVHFIIGFRMNLPDKKNSYNFNFATFIVALEVTATYTLYRPDFSDVSASVADGKWTIKQWNIYTVECELLEIFPGAWN